MSAKPTRRWPDLSQYGVALGIIGFEDGRDRLVFADEHGKYGHIARNMGFQRTRWPGVWVRDNTRLEPAAFRAVFPKVRIEERTDEEIADRVRATIREIVDATRAKQQIVPGSPRPPAASAPPNDGASGNSAAPTQAQLTPPSQPRSSESAQPGDGTINARPTLDAEELSERPAIESGGAELLDSARAPVTAEPDTESSEVTGKSQSPIVAFQEERQAGLSEEPTPSATGGATGIPNASAEPTSAPSPLVQAGTQPSTGPSELDVEIPTDNQLGNALGTPPAGSPSTVDSIQNPNFESVATPSDASSDPAAPTAADAPTAGSDGEINPDLSQESPPYNSDAGSRDDNGDQTQSSLVEPENGSADDEEGEFIDLSPVSLVEAAYPVGSNYLGEEVFVARDGTRFVRTQDEEPKVVMEGPRLTQIAADAGRFMRGDTPEALEYSAEGLVRAIAEGRNARVDDFAMFFRAVNGREMVQDDPDVERIAAVVDKVRIRYLAKLVNAGNADAFGAAMRLHNGVQYYSLVKEQITPLPVAVIMQHLASSMPSGSTVRALNDERGEFRLFAESASGFSPAAQGEVQDILLSTAEPKLLEQPLELLGTSVVRLDHAHVLRSLEQMSSEGLGVFVIGADGTPGRIGPTSRRFLDTLATLYNVEGIVDFDGSLSGTPGAEPSRIVVVGHRRETPGHGGLPTTLPYVTDYESLWTWASNIAEAIRKPGSIPFASRGAVAATVGDLSNMYQAPYVPTSLLSDPALMVPRNMASPLRRAMLRILEETPRVDDYLADQLGMTHQELKASFTAEQADALVFGLKRMEAGLGFMEADETGIGKGRVLAGLALARHRRGEPVVFLTEKAQLFSDFWRDLEDIGADKYFKNVFVLNDDETVVSTRTGDIVAKSAPREDVAKVLRSMDLPKDADIIFGTYSQFNRDPVKAARSEIDKTAPGATETARILSGKVASIVNQLNRERKEKGRAAAKSISVEAADQLADPELLATLPLAALKPLWIGRAVAGATLIMDESHNAAGEESQTNLNLVHAVMNAEGCVYSSATFARGERNMRIYRRLFPASVDVENLHETLKRGGEPLQEALTSMLAEDGALIRREHDCSMLKFHTKVDTRRVKRNERDADQLAEILAMMASLSREVRQVTDAMSEEVRKKLEALHTGRDGKLTINKSDLKKVGVVNRSPIGNSLHTIMRAFIVIEKLDLAIETGVEAVRQGQKPVFVIPHTMEAELKRALERARIAGKTEETSNGTIIPKFGFRQMLKDTLENLVGCSLDGKDLELKKSPDFAEIIRMIEEKISKFPDMALSPLDYLRQGLNEAGIQCAELSGRKLRTHTLKGGKVLVQKIATKERREAVNRFNNGDAEAIVLTAAGNSGISLHASPRFLNTAQRVLVEVEVPANIIERTQFFGRVNRNGQMSHPFVITLSSGLPAEEYTLAHLNNHMRKMSASVTGNRENAALAKDIADVLNQVGNQVVCYFLEAQPELARKLDIDLPEKLRDENDEFALYGTRYVHEMFKRLCLLRVIPQRETIMNIQKEFNRLVEELDATGSNPLKARFYDVKAKLVKSEPLEHVAQSEAPIDQDDVSEIYDILMPADRQRKARNRPSSFDKPVNISEIEYTEFFESYTPKEIKKLVEEGQEWLMEDVARHNHGQSLDVEDYFNVLIDTVLDRKTEAMQKSLRKEDESIAVALADPNWNLVKNIEYNAEQLVSILSQIRIGSVMKFTDPWTGEELDGAIVTRIRVPDMDTVHAPGRYNFTFIAPGRKNTGSMSFAALIKQRNFEIRGPYDDSTVKKFTSMRKGSHVVNRSVLDGNLFRAAEMSLQAEVGTPASYSDEQGMTHRAVVLRYWATAETFSKLPLRIHDPELAIRYYSEVDRGEMSSLSSKTKASRGLTVTFDGNDIIVSVPGTSYWSAWLRNQPSFMAITGRFEGTTDAIMAVVPRTAVRPLIEALYATGVTLYAHPKGHTVAKNDQGAKVNQSTRDWFTQRISHLNTKSTTTEQKVKKSTDPMAQLGNGRRRKVGSSI